jgi:hypothetical protein
MKPVQALLPMSSTNGARDQHVAFVPPRRLLRQP